MAALAWVVAPLVAGRLDGPVPLARTLIASLAVGLIWQFVLVLVLVYRERGSLRWSVLKDALWLNSPRSPKTGRVGGRLWLVLIPFVLLLAAEGFIPVLNAIPPVAGHDFTTFVQSEPGRQFLSGNWVWYALISPSRSCSTPSSERSCCSAGCCCRGCGVRLGASTGLPTAFLFALYHLHMPWAIPANLVDIFALAYPSRRYRSALIGIIVHSSQGVFVLVLLLYLVLR